MHKKSSKKYRLQESRDESWPDKMILEVPSAGLQSSKNYRKSVSLSSWNKQIDQSSWSEDIEEEATQRTLEHWHVVEQTLFDEEEQLQPGLLFDECLQWRNQLPHLRLTGRGVLEHQLNICNRQCMNTNLKISSATKSRGQKKDQTSKISVLEHDILSKNQNVVKSLYHVNEKKAAKEKVLDYLVEFICKELAKIETEKDVQNLSNNFSELLKISPAPTCTGKNPLNSNSFYCKVESTNTLVKKDTTMLPNKEQKKEKYLHIGRNKLGTIFNERIIVSPVPFVVTTRESFSTLRRTPIHFVKDNDAISSKRLCSIGECTKRKVSLSKKMPLMTISQMQSSWNTPTCTTIWPKNVKLTPIDTSRLPSSKRRSSKTAEDVPARRTRNSLSPIVHSVQPTSPRSSAQMDSLNDTLEIRGSHVVVQAQRLRGKVARIKPASTKLAKY